MSKIGINGKLLNAIKSMYNNVQCKVNINGVLACPSPMETILCVILIHLSVNARNSLQKTYKNASQHEITFYKNKSVFCFQIYFV